MDTNGHESGQKILFKDEVYQIVGAAMVVLNTLGHGFLEKPYEKALVRELGIRNIPYKQQARFDVVYKDAVVGEYIPDLVVHDKIIVEMKTIEFITEKNRSQILNYLKATGLKVGLVLNFGNAKLEWERFVL